LKISKDLFDYFNSSNFTPRKKRENENENIPTNQRMRHDVAYFDSQASAAATLKIDIRDIRDAKKAGCAAFRSGRVYKKPLLKWIAQKKAKRPQRPNSHDEVRRVFCEGMIDLAQWFDAGTITADQYFERCAKLIEFRGYFTKKTNVFQA